MNRNWETPQSWQGSADEQKQPYPSLLYPSPILPDTVNTEEWNLLYFLKNIFLYNVKKEIYF